VAICIIVRKALNGFLITQSQVTLYVVCTCMCFAFRADSVDTGLAI